ncbi:hypothetical protein ABE132_05105 [Peribacillus simplex]|uniref:hypothetical protein n=1 Tax=Peribacillus simplex TaxID=1478 RepID=UPI003D2AFDF5
MTKFDDYPKSIKKAIRYINQDAPLAQLRHLESMLMKSIKYRKEALKKGKRA